MKKFTIMTLLFTSLTTLQAYAAQKSGRRFNAQSNNVNCSAQGATAIMCIAPHARIAVLVDINQQSALGINQKFQAALLNPKQHSNIIICAHRDMQFIAGFILVDEQQAFPIGLKYGAKDNAKENAIAVYPTQATAYTSDYSLCNSSFP